LKTSKVFCKNLTCNKFENHLEFLRFLKRKKNLKIACFFSFFWEVFSKKLNVAKYENCLNFVKGCLKETKLLQNIKIV